MCWPDRYVLVVICSEDFRMREKCKKDVINIYIRLLTQYMYIKWRYLQQDWCEVEAFVNSVHSTVSVLKAWSLKRNLKKKLQRAGGTQWPSIIGVRLLNLVLARLFWYILSVVLMPSWTLLLINSSVMQREKKEKKVQQKMLFQFFRWEQHWPMHLIVYTTYVASSSISTNVLVRWFWTCQQRCPLESTTSSALFGSRQ